MEAEKNFIDAAVAAGCPYIVKLGTLRLYTALDSPSDYARHHAEIEAHLEQSCGSTKWTVLCPNWFMTNHLADIFGTLPKNVMVYPVDPEAKAAMIDPRDVGDIAAQLMLTSSTSADAHHTLKLDVCGPEEICLSEVAQQYTQALGRPIQTVKCSTDAWVAGFMAAGFEEWLARAVSLNFGHWDAGRFCFPSSPQVLEIAPPQRKMADWVAQMAPASPAPAASE